MGRCRGLYNVAYRLRGRAIVLCADGDFLKAEFVRK